MCFVPKVKAAISSRHDFMFQAYSQKISTLAVSQYYGTCTVLSTCAIIHHYLGCVTIDI